MLCVMSMQMCGMVFEPADERPKLDRPYFHSAVAHDYSIIMEEGVNRHKFRLEKMKLIEMLQESHKSGRGTVFSQFLMAYHVANKKKERERRSFDPQRPFEGINWSGGREKVYLPSAEKR